MQPQLQVAGNNSNGNYRSTTFEGEKFVWLIFRLQIKSKIALKLHAAEKLCSQQHTGRL